MTQSQRALPILSTITSFTSLIWPRTWVIVSAEGSLLKNSYAVTPST